MLKRVGYYAGFELLIIDELGFDKLEREEHPRLPACYNKVIDSGTANGPQLWSPTSTLGMGRILGSSADRDGAARSGRWMERSFTSFRASPIEPARTACEASRKLRQPNDDRPDLTRNDVIDFTEAFATPDSDGAACLTYWLSSTSRACHQLVHACPFMPQKHLFPRCFSG